MGKEAARPAWADRPSDEDDIWRNADTARRFSPEDHARALEGLCRMAVEMVSSQRDPRKTLRFRDALDDEARERLALVRGRAPQS